MWEEKSEYLRSTAGTKKMSWQTNCACEAGCSKLPKAAWALGHSTHRDGCAKIRYTYLNNKAYVYFWRTRRGKFESLLVRLPAISSLEYPAAGLLFPKQWKNYLIELNLHPQSIHNPLEGKTKVGNLIEMQNELQMELQIIKKIMEWLKLV